MNTQLFTSALFLASLTAFAPSVRAQQTTEPDANQRALAVQRIAERTRSTDLEIVTSSQAQLPLTGRTAAVFKLVDRASGAMHSIAFDDGGQEVDVAALIRAEVDLQRARQGRLDPAVSERLTTARPDEKLRVIVWARELESSKVVRPLPEEAAVLFADDASREAWLRDADAKRDEEVRAATSPVLARCRAAGFDAQPFAVSPVLFAELTAEQVREIARWDEVDMIYLDSEKESQLASMRGTVGAAFLETFRGITGAGVWVAQVEVGGRVQAANPFLAGTVQDTTFSCGFADSHATAVAGVMRSRHATVRGIAANLNLLSTGSCGGFASELENRSSFAADFGARVLNLSFGSTSAPTNPTGHSRFFDDLVINRFRTVVAAAGNAGATGNPRVSDPANAWNLLAVGAFNDMNDTFWPNDAISGFSSWMDPMSRHMDREEPDVAAPGENVESTTNFAPFVGFVGSGTSFATPVVSGIAAMLVQRNGTLGFWPESVRAIMMASADHNIEGATRLSERDGAGGVDATRADDIARFAYGAWGGVGYDCGSPSPMDMTSMYLVAGKRTRVAIAYDTDPSFWNFDYANAPTADLDLNIISPTGSYVAGSASYDNNYEIVDFTPGVTGWYQLRVHRYGCSMAPRYLGWAWTRDP